MTVQADAFDALSAQGADGVPGTPVAPDGAAMSTVSCTAADPAAPAARMLDAVPSADVRAAAAALARVRAERDASDDLWLFGYASLIWRPDFEPAETRPAVVHGFHRALAMRSCINRGSPECPGLVFALVAGGSCRGVALRIPGSVADAELERLWVREMPNAVYTPRWLPRRTPAGTLRALAFTLDRASPGHVGTPHDAALLDVLRTARGRYGSTLDYLLDTARCLRARGIRDRRVERLAMLAQAVRSGG